MKPQSKLFALIIIGALTILISACVPCPTTYTVTKTADTNDGFCFTWDCSLREAVLNANYCVGAQTIDLPAGGYSLTIPGINEDSCETGDLDITDDLTIIGYGAPSINGNIERAFHILPNKTVVFDHIWLTDGSAIHGGGLVNEGTLTMTSFTCNYNNAVLPPGGMGDTLGGCIYNRGDLAILGGQFLANTAEYGGAIYNNQNANLTIDDVNFVGNEADGNGGAINNDADADISITNSDFIMNEAVVNGGAVWNHGTFDAFGLYFEDNHAAGNGGGFFNWIDGAAFLTNIWLTLNTADQGGAVYNEEGMIHFYQSGMTENTATGGAGGAIYNLGPAGGLLLKNTTVSANTATGPGGGGLYNTGNFDLRFITVADNNPEGIRIDGGAEIKIRSSALSNNSGGDCAGISPDSLDYNIVSDGSCALIGGHDLLGVDPLLEPLGFYGSLAPSHRLGVGSPAIDSGVPDLCTAIDQHSTTRPQGPLCDRGAHENLYTRGIIRGWTYTDENDNSVRDPGEGAVSGALLTLFEGVCPGVADIVTVESGGAGFYEIYDIDPGVYCLATSPIQQTLDPVSYDLSIAEGTVLEDINFRYVLPVPDASASGLVWHDQCAVPYIMPVTPPPGCIELPGGGLGADGIYDPAEPGIPGLLVRLGTGPCPISLILTEAITDANGEFLFPFLFGEATYCMEVDASLSPPNDSILFPGSWTYPVRDASPAQTEITPALNEDLTGIKFGWDYKFLPSVGPSIGRCIVLKSAMVRFGPSPKHHIAYSYPEGHLVEVLARSESEPVWLEVMDARGFRGWVLAELVDCGELNLNEVETKPAPDIDTGKPEPEEEPEEEPLVCNPNLQEKVCIEAGGTWSPSTVTAPYCICP